MLPEQLKKEKKDKLGGIEFITTSDSGKVPRSAADDKKGKRVAAGERSPAPVADDTPPRDLQWWWDYSVCMYEKQYPAEECAGLNPLDANHTCTRDEFPGIIRGVSEACAQQAQLDANAINSCYDGGQGLALRASRLEKRWRGPCV